MFFVNFKTYQQATDKNAVKLAKACEKAQKNINIPIYLLVQASDIVQVKSAVNLPIWAQHIDPVEPGQATGFITALAVKKDGVCGTMLNHSEHSLSFEDLQKTVKLAKSQNLKTLICIKSINEAKKVKNLNPDFIALEDPQLIGTDISMIESQKGQEELKRFIELGFPYPLVGAGISNKKDVKKSTELGVKGVLASSVIVKARNPQKVLEELALGF